MCEKKKRKKRSFFVITAAIIPEISLLIFEAFQYRLGLQETLESKRLRTSALDAFWVRMTLTRLLYVILLSLIIVIICVSVLRVRVQGLTVTHGGEHGLHCTHKHTPLLAKGVMLMLNSSVFVPHTHMRLYHWAQSESL